MLKGKCKTVTEPQRKSSTKKAELTLQQGKKFSRLVESMELNRKGKGVRAQTPGGQYRIRHIIYLDGK